MGPATLACALAIAATTLFGCGSSEDEGDGGTTASPAVALDAPSLTASVGEVVPSFAGRPGSVLTSAVERSLGKGAAIAIKPASTQCRAVAETSSAEEAGRYPFACIVDGTAAAGGVSTEFTLGLVVFSVDGGCWKAANERIAVAAGRPLLIPRSRALEPANVISGCIEAPTA